MYYTNIHICNILNKFNHSKSTKEVMELAWKAEILCRERALCVCACVCAHTHLHSRVCGGHVSTAGCLLQGGGVAIPLA